VYNSLSSSVKRIFDFFGAAIHLGQYIVILLVTEEPILVDHKASTSPFFT
jgi:hypothetical protein